MMKQRGFAKKLVESIRVSPMLAIRAGKLPHRFIRIWAVVADGRVFVRSWSLKPRSWYRTFLNEPRGAIQIGGRTYRVRAVRTRSERLKDAVDRAYLAKYNSRASIKYVSDLCRPKSRDATIELTPMRNTGAR